MHWKRKKTDTIVVHRAEVGFDTYNFVIFRDGRVIEPIDFQRIGEHALKYNYRSVGIALVGCFARGYKAKYSHPTEEQYIAAKEIIDQLHWWYGPLNVVGHSELGKEGTRHPDKLSYAPDYSCPGLNCDMSRFR